MCKSEAFKFYNSKKTKQKHHSTGMLMKWSITTILI